MSEMIKNSDVEDVLFSIRRLVSDTPETKAAPEGEADSDPKSGALILTSALRVNDPATEPEQVDLEDMTKDLSHFRDAVGRDDVSVEDYPSLEDVFAGKSSETAPRRLHLSEVVDDDLSATDTSDAQAPIADFSEEYFEDEDTSDVTTHNWTANPDVETLGDFATSDDTFGTPFEAKVDAPAVELVASDWMEDASKEAANVPVDDVVSDDTDAADVAPEINIEDNVSDTSAETEQSQTTEEPLEAGATDGLADFDENILDEDALRDMVTEIVREELSGDLGERITRNVRKLVRREIHRALMTREFD